MDETTVTAADFTVTSGTITVTPVAETAGPEGGYGAFRVDVTGATDGPVNLGIAADSQFADAAGNLTSDVGTNEIVSGASIPADGYLDGSTYNSYVSKYVDYYYLPVVTGNTGDVTWKFESLNQTADGYLYLFKNTVNSSQSLPMTTTHNTALEVR